MARPPVRARRLTDEEGQTLLRIVRRGKQDTVRFRRALIIMASAIIAGHDDVLHACAHSLSVLLNAH